MNPVDVHGLTKLVPSVQCHFYPACEICVMHASSLQNHLTQHFDHPTSSIVFQLALPQFDCPPRFSRMSPLPSSTPHKEEESPSTNGSVVQHHGLGVRPSLPGNPAQSNQPSQPQATTTKPPQPSQPKPTTKPPPSNPSVFKPKTKLKPPPFTRRRSLRDKPPATIDSSGSKISSTPAPPSQPVIGASSAPNITPAKPPSDNLFLEEDLNLFNNSDDEDNDSSRSGLGPEHAACGRTLCNVETTEEQFMTIIVAMMASEQESKDFCKTILAQLSEIQSQIAEIASGGKGWKESCELECISQGDLQAYTATNNKKGNKHLIPHSLYARVISKIMSSRSAWRKKILPPRYGKDPDIASAIPVIDEVIVKTLRVEKSDFGLFQRWQAIHWGMNSATYKKDLLECCRQPAGVIASFFLAVSQKDFDCFDGRRTFEEVSKLTNFSLPTNEEVCEMVADLDASYGDTLSGEQEGLYEMSNVDSEEGEEEEGEGEEDED
ncbi:hypothetical protein DFH28DRAFT_926164 [Melampsora americana]|nr:hypothetical protein DFH28DRAFT_926164 [Melampsora americana]